VEFNLCFAQSQIYFSHLPFGDRAAVQHLQFTPTRTGTSCPEGNGACSFLKEQDMKANSAQTLASTSLAADVRAALEKLSGSLVELDAMDQEIVARCYVARQKFSEPCMGDYLLFPSGELERFSSDWGDRIQTSPSGGFYLTDSGFGDLSCGALNPSTPKESLKPTEIFLPGRFWIFHHSIAGAGRGVWFNIPCRVFTTSAKYEGLLGQTFASPQIAAYKAQLDSMLKIG